MSDGTYNMALKVPMAMIERLDALVGDVEAEYQHLQAAGLIRKVSRSTVARLVMDAGLIELESRYLRRAARTEGAPTTKPATGADEPASAFLREYRRPSRRSKPATVAGQLLRKWRESSALSQAQAAERVGRGQATWGKWEKGTITPPAALRAELEDLAGIGPDDWTTPADGEG